MLTYDHARVDQGLATAMEPCAQRLVRAYGRYAATVLENRTLTPAGVPARARAAGEARRAEWLP